MKPFLSIIIPAYNEAKRLPLTLLDIDRHVGKAEYSSEVIVIDDGSVDGTFEIAERFSHLMKAMRVIQLTSNQGKGAAVRAGMLAAKGNWRLIMDADNSTDVQQFDKMLPFFKEGYDIVIGSRGVKGATLEPPQKFLKRFAGILGNVFIQRLLLPGIGDTQCGFKCFSEDAANVIFKNMRLAGWAWDVEALMRARSSGYRIKEMPVRWVNDPSSKVTFGSYFRTLWDVFKIWWWRKKKSFYTYIFTL